MGAVRQDYAAGWVFKWIRPSPTSGRHWCTTAATDSVVPMNDVLDEAYGRLHRMGPEWSEDELTNHGPMAAEVLVRRGQADAVERWVDRYIRRLDPLPSATAAITEADWTEALGDGRRVGDWVRFFERQLAEHPWREVLATWWERLLPGILAGTTHGVIRVSHAVRALLAHPETEPETPATLTELAHGLAFWASRSQPLPPVPPPAGAADPAAALDSFHASAARTGGWRTGSVSSAGPTGWSSAVAALRPAGSPDEVRDRLADLVTAASQRYLRYGHGSPVLLVHLATAPNAVLHSLPALPTALWQPSLTAVWTTTAAIFSAYAPPDPAPIDAATDAAGGGRPVADVVDRALAHGDEHVIKFTDTAAEAYARSGDPAVLGGGAAHRHAHRPSRLRSVPRWGESTVDYWSKTNPQADTP